MPLPEHARHTLCRLGWLSRQPELVQRSICEAGNLVTVPANRALNEFGEPGGTVMAIVSGWVDEMIAPATNDPCLLHISGAGAWEGDTAFLLKFDRIMSVQTRTNCEVAVFSETKLRWLTREIPEVWESLAELSAGHIEMAMSVIATHSERDPVERLKKTLLRLIGEGFQYGWGFPDGPVDFPVNQNELGEMCQLSRNSIGAALKKLETIGAIEVKYRKIRILDRAILKNWHSDMVA